MTDISGRLHFPHPFLITWWDFLAGDAPCKYLEGTQCNGYLQFGGGTWHAQHAKADKFWEYKLFLLWNRAGSLDTPFSTSAKLPARERKIRNPYSNYFFFFFPPSLHCLLFLSLQHLRASPSIFSLHLFLDLLMHFYPKRRRRVSEPFYAKPSPCNAVATLVEICKLWGFLISTSTTSLNLNFKRARSEDDEREQDILI